MTVLRFVRPHFTTFLLDRQFRHLQQNHRNIVNHVDGMSQVFDRMDQRPFAVDLGSEIILANSLYAPGTPAGSCLNHE